MLVGGRGGGRVIALVRQLMMGFGAVRKCGLTGSGNVVVAAGCVLATRFDAG